MKRWIVTLAMLLPLVSVAQDQVEGTPPADTPAAPPAPATQDTPPVQAASDPAAEELARVKQEKDILVAMKEREEANLQYLDKRYPKAAVADIRKGEVTGYEHAAFLADFALTASAAKLAQNLGEKMKKVCEIQTLLVDDVSVLDRIALSKSLMATLGLMLDRAKIIDRLPPEVVASKDEQRSKESAQFFAAAQSIVTQTIDLMKYFRTDVEVKAAAVTFPSFAFRSQVASHCANALLPELKVATKTDLLDRYSELTLYVERIRTKLAQKLIPVAYVADANSLVAAVDAFRTSTVQAAAGATPPIVEAQRYYELGEVPQVGVVKVLNSGGTIYRRSNLFFLTQKVSTLSTVSVHVVVSTAASGNVVFSGIAQAKTQSRARFSKWRNAEPSDTVISVAVP